MMIALERTRWPLKAGFQKQVNTKGLYTRTLERLVLGVLKGIKGTAKKSVVPLPNHPVGMGKSLLLL